MSRLSYLIAAVAFVLVALTSVFQLAEIPLAAAIAFILGVIAGRGAHLAGRSAVGAGVIVGLGALLGAVAGLAVPAGIAGSIPGVQAFVQASEPHPEARIPTELIAPVAGAAGALVGLLLGCSPGTGRLRSEPTAAGGDQFRRQPLRVMLVVTESPRSNDT